MSKRRTFILRQCALFIVNCAFWALVLFLVQRHVCFIAVTANDEEPIVAPRGSLVFVNRLAGHTPKEGDNIVYVSNGTHFGKVCYVPGDTIWSNDAAYLLPLRCCDQCNSNDCQPYVLHSENKTVLIHKSDIVGAAYPLRNLRHLFMP